MSDFHHIVLVQSCLRHFDLIKIVAVIAPVNKYWCMVLFVCIHMVEIVHT